MLDLSLGMGLGVGRRALFVPGDLGADLLANWDAEVAASLTLDGSAVTTWADAKNGYAPTQATPAAKPVWSATSFGGRPGITFDGVDDALALSSNPFPTGAAGWEIWALVDQTALPADASTRAIFTVGDTANTSRILVRRVQTGVNLVGAAVGNAGGSNPFNNSSSAVFTGRHVVRLSISPTTSTLYFDGTSGNTSAIVPTTSGSLVAIGRATSLGVYFQGVMNSILVTNLLTAPQAALLTAYLKSRGGIA